MGRGSRFSCLPLRFLPGLSHKHNINTGYGSKGTSALVVKGAITESEEFHSPTHKQHPLCAQSHSCDDQSHLLHPLSPREPLFHLFAFPSANCFPFYKFHFTSHQPLQVTCNMSSHRASKSGLAAESQAKMESKYDEELAASIMTWIRQVTQDDTLPVDGSKDSVHETLKDGVVLCRLVNAIKANSIPQNKINQSEAMFKCFENIDNFLKAASQLGVKDHELFATIDLWERQNLAHVLVCLSSLARKAVNYGLPSLGPKESESNVRKFSPEQLNAGHTVIGLQYGTNKCANQSGLNFGNTRHM